jgi:hypothetical protein
VQTSSVDKQLKHYVMRTFAVKQRVLQRWLKAGVVPGAYRTKGRHYRVRAPKGMTADKLPTFEAVRVATETQKNDFPVRAYFAASQLNGIPSSFVHWFCQLRLNVRDYRHFLRQISQLERKDGIKVPFYTLAELRTAAKKGAWPSATSTSPRDVADFLSSFEPMGANPLEQVQ